MKNKRGMKKGVEDKKRKHAGIFYKKNKIALSTIIVTLLIVLLSLIALGILWGVISNLLEKQSELTQIQSKFFGEQISIMNVKYDEPFLNITLRKPAGEIKVGNINITTVGTPPMSADVFSVVDLSGSMIECYGINESQCDILGGDYRPGICDSLLANKQSGCLSYGGTWSDKLTATQSANRQLINSILTSGTSRMGLVAYRDSMVSASSINLTNDANALNTTISSWTANYNTCICCGINDAALRLTQQSSQEKVKSIIVMSDGQANVRCGQQGTGNAKNDAIKAACDANASLNNLVIYSIGVQGADAATLTNISNCGGGKYFSVTNISELMIVYQGIAQQINEKYLSLTSLSYLSVVFFNATNSYTENVYDMPDILQSKTYSFNLQGQLSGTLIRIEVYPVAVTSDKKIVIGPMMDVWIPR